MPLNHIEYGSLASSQVMNENFEYLDNRISNTANSLVSTSSSIYSNIASLETSVSEQNESLSSDIDELDADLESLRNDFDSVDEAPDYDRGIALEAFPYTVENDGYIDVAIAALSGTAALFINNIKIGHAWSSEISFYSMISGQYQVCAGDVITYNGILQWMSFYPKKEVADVL